MKRTYITIVLLTLLYLATRFWGLRNLPMFIDEAIYAQWAQMGFLDAGARLVSLADGKPPLFIWASTTMMRFIGNPITAGRIVSIGSGFLSLLGMYLLTWELYKNRKTALCSILLYILFPLSLLFNRFALMDTMIGMFAIWSIYLEILLVRTLRWDVMFALALVLAGR